jgi:hypothetical protein
LPLTEPKVSAVEASVYDIDQWESDWMGWHRDHVGGEYITYGDLGDEDRPYASDAKEDGSWEEDSDTGFLVKCCGEDRPLRMGGVRLVVTPAAGNHFVTVHDYVSGKSSLSELMTFLMMILAVHLWLMSLREDILKAKTTSRGQPYSTLASTEWMVSMGPEHMIDEKARWIRRHGGGSPRPIPAAILNIMRARRDQ